MSNYKFEAGKTYPLRGGGAAEILKVGAKTSCGETIVGLRMTEYDTQDISLWYSNGKYFASNCSHKFDLLPPEAGAGVVVDECLSIQSAKGHIASAS